MKRIHVVVRPEPDNPRRFDGFGASFSVAVSRAAKAATSSLLAACRRAAERPAGRST